MYKKIIFYFSIIIASTMTPLVFANQSITAAKTSQQKIQGAFAFPISGNNKVMVRIGIDPNKPAQEERDIAAAMSKITVVACAAGACEFAKSNAGLGFFEAEFQLTPALYQAKKFNLLVIACSASGCTQASLTSKIISPEDK